MAEQTTIDSFAEFNSFRSDKASFESEDWSEADTRSKLIDRLLIKCLEWPESCIRREITIKNERLDYLSSVERPVLVVEAKRHSLTFAIPPKKPFFKIKLSTLLQGNPSLEPDVEQVQNYCSTWSVPYAALTNGKQLLIFCAFRYDGKPWRDGIVYVFSDLFGKYDYADLFGLLSRHAFVTNEVYSQFYRMPRVDRAKSLISVYTRIHDENLMQQLLETYKEGIKPSVHRRLKVVGGWVSYLQREEEMELTGRRGCQVFGLPPIGPGLQKTWENEKERVLASIARTERIAQFPKAVPRNPISS